MQSREMQSTSTQADPPRRVRRSDRWAWRRRIRADPHAYRWYRLGVGVIGTLLILLGFATGWLPGPGGIPLVLLGLAVLASEYRWARRLLHWARVKVHEFSTWARRQPIWVRWSGGALTAGGVLCAIWVALVVFGLPGWVPGQVAGFLTAVPGIDGP